MQNNIGCGMIVAEEDVDVVLEVADNCGVSADIV